MNKKLVIIAIALVIFAIVVAPVAAAPAIKRLTSPSLLSPANNAQLTNGDHQVMLQWKPVDDPRVTDYLIEVQGYWSQMEFWGRLTSSERIATNTWYQVDCFPAAGGALDGWFNYRWRVTARASDPGSTSAPSSWHYFSFPTPTSDVRLAPVNVISPANKIVISAGTPLNYKWELVPGQITYYLFFCQKLTDNKEWKMEPPTTVLSDNPPFPISGLSYTDTPGTFRFRVVAYGTVPNSYSVSAWRYFTVV
jgi:hypothetical protein